jgi:hypothetical protein
LSSACTSLLLSIIWDWIFSRRSWMPVTAVLAAVNLTSYSYCCTAILRPILSSS